MVIISTSATEVSIQAVSPPELGVQFVSTAGTAGTAAYLSVASSAATAAAQAGVAGGGGLGGGGGGGSAARRAAGARRRPAPRRPGSGVASSAKDGAGAAKPISAATASAGAKPLRNRVSFIV